MAAEQRIGGGIHCRQGTRGQEINLASHVAVPGAEGEDSFQGRLGSWAPRELAVLQHLPLPGCPPSALSSVAILHHLGSYDPSCPPLCPLPSSRNLKLLKGSGPGDPFSHPALMASGPSAEEAGAAAGPWPGSLFQRMATVQGCH